MGRRARFYSLWAKETARGAWGKAEGVSGAIGAAALAARKLWPETVSVWIDTLWQLPLYVFGAILLSQVFGTKERREELVRLLEGFACNACQFGNLKAEQP